MPENLIFNAIDLGITPNSTDDIIPAVQHALDTLSTNNGGILHFPAGEYHFYPQNAIRKDYFLSNSDVKNPRCCAFLLANLHDITIEGEDETIFIFHGRIIPFVLDNAKEIIIRNLTIDWFRPLGSEGKVVAVDKKYIDLEIDPIKFPYHIEREKIFFRY